MPAEFRQFVQEQDTVMSKGNFPGARLGTAADQCDSACRMVGRPKTAGFPVFEIKPALADGRN
jgi:hypothetical protein